jgi:hypothetical protein
MVWGKAVLDGRLEAPLPDDFLDRLAVRARAGRFGTAGKRYEVETFVGDGGYRTAARTERVQLRARGEGPAHVLDDLTLERAADGSVTWRVDLARFRRRRLAFSAAILLGAIVLGVARLSTHALSFLLPVVAVVFFSLWSGARRSEEKARSAVLAALHAERDDERLDEALGGSGANLALARAIVERLEERGLVLTDDERARIVECDDLALLEQWRANAERCTSTGEVFEGLRIPTAGPRVAEPAPAADGEADEESADEEAMRR